MKESRNPGSKESRNKKPRNHGIKEARRNAAWIPASVKKIRLKECGLMQSRNEKGIMESKSQKVNASRNHESRIKQSTDPRIQKSMSLEIKDQGTRERNRRIHTKELRHQGTERMQESRTPGPTEFRNQGAKQAWDQISRTNPNPDKLKAWLHEKLKE